MESALLFLEYKERFTGDFMKKLVLAVLAGLMVLGSLKALAEDEVTQVGQFEVYEQKDKQQEFKVVLIPAEMAQKIQVIDKAQLSDTEKVAQVADLFVQLAADNSADSFCSVSAKVYSSRIKDQAEQAKEMAREVETCHKKMTKERIMKKADRLFSQDEVASIELRKEVTAPERYRIAYSLGFFLLML